MANVKSVDFYDLCRICTATTEQKIDIFSPEGKTKNLNDKIAECLSLNVNISIKLIFIVNFNCKISFNRLKKQIVCQKFCVSNVCNTWIPIRNFAIFVEIHKSC